MRLLQTCLFALGLSLSLATAQADTVNVDVRSNFFKTTSNVPGQNTNKTTINAGDTVHWTWFGNFHSVTSDALTGSDHFDSGVHNSGTTFDHTYNTPGTFVYHCSIHGAIGGIGMSGQITVLAKVSGTLTLDGIDANAPAQSISFEFRPTDGSAKFTLMQNVSPSGAFTLTGIPSKNYNVAIKGAKYLQKVVPVDTSSGNVSNVTATLLGGDADNNNVVDFDDLTILAIAYNTAKGDGSGLYDDRADFNGDGQVEFADLTILAINYNLAGDP